MATVTNEEVQKVLDQLRAIYGVLEMSHQELLALFGEGQKDDDEQLMESGVIPQIQGAVSRLDSISRNILDNVIRVRDKLG